jgi:hypothetical protein
MNEINHNHHHHPEADSDNVQHDRRPYWKHVHHDWRFWVAVLLMLAAMVIYVMSDDLRWRPGRQPQQPMPAAVAQ